MLTNEWLAGQKAGADGGDITKFVARDRIIPSIFRGKECRLVSDRNECIVCGMVFYTA